MAHDPIRDRTVLFGGWNDHWGSPHYGPLGDTWEFDGQDWHPIATPSAPSARHGHRMVYDASRARVVLFGGEAASGPSDETWEFDGANWSPIATATRPSARHGHGMAYDTARRACVVFGGVAWPALFDDTWQFVAGAWQQVPTANRPGGGPAHLCADVRAGRLLAVDSAASTWHFDGTDWSLASPQGPAWSSALAYDPLRGRVASWQDEWSGSGWQVATSFVGFGDFVDNAMVYEIARQRLFSFGGRLAEFGSNPIFGGCGSLGQPPCNPARSESFVLERPATPSFTRHGQGCSTGTAPELDTIGNLLPALGQPFPLRVTGLPPASAPTVFWFGFDFVQWQQQPLPFDLAVLGMPGCDLWIAPAIPVVAPAAGGTAAVQLSLPSQPALAGAVLGAQALALDASAPNGVGSWSNACLLRMH